MRDITHRPLRKPIALWSVVLAGVLTILLLLDWVISRHEPPGGLCQIIIAFLSVPSAVYMGTSAYEAVRMPRSHEGYGERDEI